VIAFIDAPFRQHPLVDVQESAPFLTASFLIVALLVAAIRVVASMPIAARANWIFQITELRSVPEYSTANRNTTILLAVVPACILTWFYLSYRFSPNLATNHLLVLGLVGTILVEVSLHNFQKIPFTCSYLPGKGNLQYVFWMCAFVALPIIRAGARLEARLFNERWGFSAMIMILIICSVGFRLRVKHEAQSSTNITFEEASIPEISALSLHGE
jgi:hypothetical protein